MNLIRKEKLLMNEGKYITECLYSTLVNSALG